MIGFSLCGWSLLILLGVALIGYAAFRAGRTLAKRLWHTSSRSASLVGLAVGSGTFMVLLILAYHAFSYPAMPLFALWRDAMVGTWAPPPDGIQRTSDDDFGLFSCTFVFHADGTFEISSPEG